MTHPNYQQPQYAPPGYGYPPQGGQPVPMAPQFAPPQPTPQPTYTPPAAAQHNAGLPQGDFADPRVGGGDLAPRIRHLVGRTIIVEPIRIDENAKGLPDNNGNATVRPAAYAHVTVVDGGPILFGDEIKAGRQIRPNTHQVNAPYRIMNMMISNTWIVNAVRDALPPLGNGLLLGVIEEGTQGNRPFLLTKCESNVDGSDRPDGAQRREAARQLWNAIKAGQFTNPTPVLLQPVAGAGYGAPMYGQPQPQYAPPMQPGYVPTPYGQTPIGAVHPAYAAAVTEPGAAVHAPQPVSAAPTAAATAGLPPGFDVTQCPPGWDAGQWQAFASNPAQATAIWLNVLSQQQPAPAAAPQPAPQPDPAQQQAQYAGAAYQAMNTMNGGVPGPTWT